MGKRGSTTRPKDEDSMDIGPDSDKDTTDSEPLWAAKEVVEPLFKKQKKSKVEESDDDSDDAGEAKAKAEGKSADPCKVIVSHIPWGEKDKKEVLTFFDDCGGAIVTHDLPPRVGILIFDSEEAAKKAQKLNGTEFRGGTLRIRLASAPISASIKRTQRKKAKAAAETDPAATKKVPLAKSAREGKKPGSQMRRGAGKQNPKLKSGAGGAVKNKFRRGQAILARKRKERLEQRKAMTKEERRKSYSDKAKLGTKGRGTGQPFLGRGGGRGQGGRGQGGGAAKGGRKPFAGRGGGGGGRGSGKPFAGRGGGGGGGKQDKKAAASKD